MNLFPVWIVGVWALAAASEPARAAEALPNVVKVEAFTASSANPHREPVATALGFMVEKEGFLLTVYQRLVHQETGDLLPLIKVTVAEGAGVKTYDATIIGVEPTLDFALLKIDRPEPFVISTIGQGTVAAPNIRLRAFPGFPPSGETWCSGRLLDLNSIECYQENLTQSMFRADLRIPLEAVGTPVFADDGAVVALFTGYEPPHLPGDESEDEERVTHLLPVTLLFNIYNSIKQRQSLASPWTGFSVRRLSPEEQRQFPIADGRFAGGIALEFIWKDSPAEAMGLKNGDILVRFAYNPILSPADFQRWLYLYGVGRSADLYIARDGKVTIHKYTIEERPDWAVPR